MSKISVENYEFQTWGEKYPTRDVDVTKLSIDDSWKECLFDNNDEHIERVNKFIKFALNKTDGEIKLFPYPDLIFYGFKSTPFNKIKVVIIGQDPYHGYETYNNKMIPQAMGMAFSVPIGIKIPSSLQNIYKNLVTFGHLDKKPTHGNLSGWTKQGVLLLNTSLSVQCAHPNVHKNKWNGWTDNIIKYINGNTNNVAFLLWGSPASKKEELIDKSKHKIIISSHPSGLSNTKPMGNYPAFNDCDHFGKTNEFLKENKIKQIKWDKL